MTGSIAAASPSRSAEHSLAELIEELSARLEAGEPVDLQACLDAHPEHAGELRRLYPALQLLADFSRSGEANLPPDGPEPQSALALADRLVSRGSSPSARLRRSEQRHRVQAILGQLADADREVLVLRYLEHLSTQEMSAILGLTPAGVKTRQLRALRRLRDLLGDDVAEDMP